MNASKFDTIVRNRANERVQARVAEFRTAVNAALRKLHRSFGGGYYDGFIPNKIPEDVQTVLNNVAVGMYFQMPVGEVSNANPMKPCEWPRILWEDEMGEVEKQLLATMDEMQKALCAPERSAEDAPPVPKPTSA